MAYLVKCVDTVFRMLTNPQSRKQTSCNQIDSGQCENGSVSFGVLCLFSQPLLCFTGLDEDGDLKGRCHTLYMSIGINDEDL